MTPDQIADAKAPSQRDARLWSAVLLQALEDATSPLPTTEGYARSTAIRAQKEARAWFERDSKDFKEVCALAGMDSDWIRANALKRIAEADANPEQKFSSHNPRTLTHNSITLTIPEWSKRTGISSPTIHIRLNAGLPIEQVLTPGKIAKPAQTYEHNGEALTAKEWSARTGIKVDTLKHRISKGWSIADAVTLTKEQAKARSVALRDESFKLMHAKCRASAKQKESRHSVPRAKLYTHNGESLTAKQWSDRLGVNVDTIYQRLSKGWTIERALTVPLGGHRSDKEKVKAPKTPKPAKLPRTRQNRVDAKRYEHNGQLVTLRELSALTGITLETIRSRASRGWTVEQMLMPRIANEGRWRGRECAAKATDESKAQSASYVAHDSEKGTGEPFAEREKAA